MSKKISVLQFLYTTNIFKLNAIQSKYEWTATNQGRTVSRTNNIAFKKMCTNKTGLVESICATATQPTNQPTNRTNRTNQNAKCCGQRINNTRPMHNDNHRKPNKRTCPYFVSGMGDKQYVNVFIFRRFLLKSYI